jgi:hypothetical protein
MSLAVTEQRGVRIVEESEAGEVLETTVRRAADSER